MSSRFTALSPLRQDLIAAALLWLEATIELVAGRGSAAAVALGAALMLVLYGALAIRRRAPLLALALAIACVIGAMAADPRPGGVSDFVFAALIMIGSPFLAGRTLRDRARLTEALAAKARRADHEREAHAEQAVLSERTRVAGELHDVVAHALSAMTVQASAARRLATADPARAEQAFAAVEGAG